MLHVSDWYFFHPQGASASAVYEASKNRGAVGSGASDSGKVVPDDKGTKTISFFTHGFSSGLKE